MPELRKDPIIGRWVIIATERKKRPTDFRSEQEIKKTGFCPFCPGNEDKTPPEIFSNRADHSAPDTPGWTLRIVPNKFPALQIEGNLKRKGEGIFDKMNGIGAHEVIIETPDHKMALADLPIAMVSDVIRAYRSRTLDLVKDQRFRYAMIFKNHGEVAGASLEHSHSQLIATPIVPKRVTEELEGASTYFNFKERCIFCDIIRQELEDKRRVTSENEHFVAVSPYAPRFPFETWILPKAHQSNFEDILDGQIGYLAKILKEVLIRMNLVLEDPPYNYLIHTAPFNKPHNPYYHWHIEIIPKLTKVAGFEWGTGFYINPTPPEEATEYLSRVETESYM